MKTLTIPATAYLNFDNDLVTLGHCQSVVIELHDPRRTHGFLVRDHVVPLEKNLTTPLAYGLADSGLEEQQKTAPVGGGRRDLFGVVALYDGPQCRRLDCFTAILLFWFFLFFLQVFFVVAVVVWGFSVDFAFYFCSTSISETSYRNSMRLMSPFFYLVL